MYVLFEDGGKFLAGRLMSQADASLQVELESGKRVKVKAANALIQFAAPLPAELFARARTLADEIDLDLAWEFAPDGEFGFADLAREYFDAAAGVEKQAAALFRLFDAPHYFRRCGKGVFRKAPHEVVKAALLGIERKRKQAEQIDAWATDLAAGRCPDPVREQLYRILFKPDKNAAEYKAVVEAARRTQRGPLELLQGAGAITSPYQFHWRRFLFDQFAHGTGFPDEAIPAAPAEELPAAGVQAFSIDDSATTEIDDALSVRGLGSGVVVLGIHIAAPGLAIAPDSPWDRVARGRLSTVYMPGWKLTMLPDDLVERYTLAEGRDCPAMSLYLRIDERSLAVLEHETRVERVSVAANLRHDRLDDVVTESALRGDEPARFPFAAELAFCHRLALALKARREVVRGRPETFTRPDYTFRLKGREGLEPDGSETVSISPRRRGAPLDLIVAEAMILANTTWGGWLAERAVPGIYRSQASLAPGIKVRMGTRPAPHAGMGVAQYIWATSPLRRYVDLVNQWQLLACARHGTAAALAAPFKPKDTALMSIVSAFDATYAAYGDFQHGIERFWALRRLQQQGTQELDASVMSQGLVRAAELPLVFRLGGTESMARGTAVRARIAGIDLLTLELHAQLVATLGPAAPAMAEPADDNADEESAGALTLAIALDDTDAQAIETVHAAGAAAQAGDAPAAAG